MVAAAALFLSTLFRVIVATHYVLWNLNIVADPQHWLAWYYTFNLNEKGYTYSRVDDGFVEGYRTTVDEFPVVQAVFEPLGVVMAAAMVIWWRKRNVIAERVV